MKRSSEQFDQLIQNQLESWKEKIGRPSCSAGCSNCCHHTTVIITPSEALRVLDFIATLPEEKGASLRKLWETRMRQLEDQLMSKEPNPQQGVNALLSFGNCIFLDKHLCSVYSARPDACRSFYVWHSADYCGQPNIEMCPPAELAQLRLKQFYACLLVEAENGYLPFWGHLMVMIAIMDRYREAYLDGKDLALLVPELWSESGLLHFIKPRDTSERIIDFLKTEEGEYDKLFAEEPWPLGLPRVANVQSRNELGAFILDPKWL